MTYKFSGQASQWCTALLPRSVVKLPTRLQTQCKQSWEVESPCVCRGSKWDWRALSQSLSHALISGLPLPAAHRVRSVPLNV